MKKKILDVRIPKDQQKELLKQKKYTDVLLSKKYKVDIQFPDGSIRYMYGDDVEIFEDYAKSLGAKIIKVAKLWSK